ncbi:MAG TPA: hypothetical protein VHS31_16195 [Tepidisphaeraceae bacterium]|jgi:hypothetical protein|nr:hypothetical protein [Tepidisphaeraceae bacterium]
MLDLFRDQPKVRLAIGAVFIAIVWGLYVIRVTAGVGPMRDDRGNQAPVHDYLVGAGVVTGMVVGWIVLRTMMTRRMKRE